MSDSAAALTLESLVDEACILGGWFDRPLRYVQINSFYNGSTGVIMRNIHRQLMERGVDSYIFWGRRHETVNDHERCFATKLGYLSHGMFVRMDDRMGFHSKYDTERLLKALDDIDPDVVHLHNLHGYYINIEMLFAWLARHRCQVRWTLHDCWAFTGHCAHFDYVGCTQWISHCALSSACPQHDVYPRTICRGNCARNFADKKRIFTSVDPERMTLITPSYWLKRLVEQSFLKQYVVKVCHNTIDRSVFKPISSDFRSQYNIGDRFMVLGVASPWTKRKGLIDFARLADVAREAGLAVVLVGLTKRQVKTLPVEFIRLGRTGSARELAKIYSAADVFFNPTHEDNFPTVNLEAEACGTPVWTYDTGGCRETIGLVKGSRVISGLEEAVALLSFAQRGMQLQ